MFRSGILGLCCFSHIFGSEVRTGFHSFNIFFREYILGFGGEHFMFLIIFLRSCYLQVYETKVSFILAARLWSSRLVLFLW